MNFLLFLLMSAGSPEEKSERPELFGTPIFSLNENTSETLLLHKPSHLTISENGHVYLLDKGTMVVHKFDLQGRHLLTLGGKGQGPGEFFRPHAIALAGPFLWVTDYGNGRVQIFKEDVFWKVLETEMRVPKNAIALDGDIYVSGPTVDAVQGPILVYRPDGTFLRSLSWSQNLNSDKGKVQALWNRMSLEPMPGNRILVGYHFENALAILGKEGTPIVERTMDRFYETYEDKREGASFPAGYAAMSFSAGPNDSVLVAVCDNERRKCDQIFMFNKKLDKLLHRYQKLGASITFLRYFEEMKMLAVTKKNTEVSIYAVD